MSRNSDLDEAGNWGHSAELLCRQQEFQSLDPSLLLPRVHRTMKLMSGAKNETQLLWPPAQVSETLSSTSTPYLYSSYEEDEPVTSLQ